MEEFIQNALTLLPIKKAAPSKERLLYFVIGLFPFLF